MHTIALVTQKGGSGKSTLSASLAVEAQSRGEKVFLVDMDPQKSLTTWAQNRADERLGVEAVTPRRLGAVLETLEASGVTLAVIDTPASLSAASESAMMMADLIVMPVRPTVFDIWSSEATWRRIRELRKDCVFVLNQCSILQGSRRVKESAAALEAMGGLLQPMITARVDYQDAMLRGLGPTEVDATGPAADEIRQLWQSLRRRVARARFDRRAAQIAA